MAIEKEVSHKAGPLKQTNKKHKGSKSNPIKGKVSVKTITKRNKRELCREERRHQALQIRQNKRDEVLAKKRSLGSMERAPFLIAVVPLFKNFDPRTAITLFTQCDEETVVNVTSAGVTHIYIPRFKQRFSFVAPQIDNELAVLDYLKVCDTVLFLISAAHGIGNDDILIDEWGHNILTATFAQGLPTPVVAVTDLESIAPKKRNDRKQHIQKLVHKWLADEKLMVLDKNVDAVNILRRIGNQKRKSLFKDRRPHLLSEEVEYVPDLEGTLGTLKVTGYLRGTVLSVNQLVHIPGLGDFQMLQIDAPCDPNRIEKNRYGKNKMGSSEPHTVRVLEIADPSEQESLDPECIPETKNAEETLPTSEEIKLSQQKTEKEVKKTTRVPKGWSDYQAAWIPEDDTEFQEDLSTSEEGSEEEDSFDESMDAVSEERTEIFSQKNDNDFETATESEVPVNDERYDKEMDYYAEKEDLEKLKAAKEDRQFPDELDTPMDQLASVRFQKYRWLESFRTSPWNPKEDLPSDYSRIFTCENFNHARKKILKEQADKDGVAPGQYITIHIKGVSQLLWSTFKQTNSPVVLIGLLPYEHKMTVLNTVLKRTKNFDLPIKSKERLIFQCGYRRFIVNPIFSSHVKGQKHKFERFFQPNSTVVATFYAPVQLTTSPVLCYKEINNSLVLIAAGNLLSCNPDRLIIKRIVLSGHPFKIHKKSAVIRFMFFNREDILYYKQCQLRTKMGRVGHIKEPLGTHGHMKCIFDGQLKSPDTVLLNLYKRVFPKWSYEDLIVSCIDNETMET